MTKPHAYDVDLYEHHGPGLEKAALIAKAVKQNIVTVGNHKSPVLEPCTVLCVDCEGE